MVQDLQRSNSELQARLDEELAKNAEIKRENNAMIQNLKRRASFAQELLNGSNKKSEGGDEK